LNKTKKISLLNFTKSKLPDGLKNIINERNALNLRNRQFIRDRSWKQDSIAYRLATRAKKEIKEIEVARSKKRLDKEIQENLPFRI